MRCSVSPFARASCVCILMQLAQPLIWDARISISRIRVGSRLEAAANDVAAHFFMRSGATAKRSLAFMVGTPLVGFRYHDEPEPADVTSRPRFFACRRLD